MELIIFMGLQASGKSTFYRSHFAATHAYVSKDLLHNNKKPGRRQMQLVEEALKAGQSVVVDNTNPTPQEREPLIRLGHEYGAEVIGYYFESQVRPSLERNTTAKKLIRPSYTEGFDKLYDVRIVDDVGFEVREWVQNEVQ